MQHIPKKSLQARCPAFELFCLCAGADLLLG